MQYEKTGCVVLFEEWSFYLRGDSFAGDDFHIFRLNNLSRQFSQPEGPLHYLVHEIAHAWDEHDPKKTSTYVVYDHKMENFLYDQTPGT